MSSETRIQLVGEIMHREVRTYRDNGRWSHAVAIEMVDWLHAGVPPQRIASEYVAHYAPERLSAEARESAVEKLVVALGG